METFNPGLGLGFGFAAMITRVENDVFDVEYATTVVAISIIILLDSWHLDHLVRSREPIKLR